jgi:hypothetical protein
MEIGLENIGGGIIAFSSSLIRFFRIAFSFSISSNKHFKGFSCNFVDTCNSRRLDLVEI